MKGLKRFLNGIAPKSLFQQLDYMSIIITCVISTLMSWRNSLNTLNLLRVVYRVDHLTFNIDVSVIKVVGVQSRVLQLLQSFNHPGVALRLQGWSSVLNFQGYTVGFKFKPLKKPYKAYV